ncbi:MAG: nuclear transport factor 2 family protein [Frankiales bacterium]|nr:nuclear transport factor 2 family protein [Frankiales bacterium]
MTQALVSNIERDGETRKFQAHGSAAITNAGGATFMRGTFEPGWRWSTDVAPIAGTTSCQTRHLGYVISGRIAIRNDDGTEFELGPGDVFDLPAGHDAWTLGEEPCVMVDISPDVTHYAKGAMATKPQDDKYQALVRRGYTAFNAGDLATLSTLLAKDVVQRVPGTSVVAGDHKGLDAVLGMYGKLAELTDGTVRAHLTDLHSDGDGHVLAVHVIAGTRNGVTRASRGSLLFTFVGEKVSEIHELRADGPGDDAWMA